MPALLPKPPGHTCQTDNTAKSQWRLGDEAQGCGAHVEPSAPSPAVLLPALCDHYPEKQWVCVSQRELVNDQLYGQLLFLGSIHTVLNATDAKPQSTLAHLCLQTVSYKTSDNILDKSRVFVKIVGFFSLGSSESFFSINQNWLLNSKPVWNAQLIGDITHWHNQTVKDTV